MLGLLGFMALACFWSPTTIPSMICVLIVIGLIINSMYWILPFSYAIYPERVVLLLLLPFALGIAALLNGVRQVLTPKQVMLWAVAALILFAAVHHNEKLLYRGLIPNALVTTADLQVMRWIQENTEYSVVSHSRYGDAGLWLPTIAFRGITDPHLNRLCWLSQERAEQQSCIRRVKAREIPYIPLVPLTPMALEMGRRALTNGV